jgi:hypothetical protein
MVTDNQTTRKSLKSYKTCHETGTFEKSYNWKLEVLLIYIVKICTDQP